MNGYIGKIGNGASQVVQAPIKNGSKARSKVNRADKDLRSGG